MVDKSAAARPDIARAIEHLRSLAVPTDPPLDPVARMRRTVDRYGQALGPRGVGDAAVARAATGAFAAEWVVAARARTDARLAYLHGGGWIAGGPGSHRVLAAELSQSSGRAVLLVDYRLAPEHPFPAGFDDCLAAVRWAALNGPDGRGDAATLALGGDSAGGNLSAAVCAALVEAGERPPGALVLISAVLDARPDAVRPAVDDPVVSADGIARLMAAYAPPDLADPRVSPLLTDASTLAAFPPTLIQVGAHEALAGDASAFAERLLAAGRRVAFSAWPEVPHVWHAFSDLLPEARAAIAEAGAFLHSTEAVP